MSALDPITPFLTLIDRIISLIQARKTRRKEYFEKIVEPLYVQFVPLAEDYLRLFRDAKQKAAGGKRDRKKSLLILTEKRNAFGDSRNKLRALIEVREEHARKKSDEELVSFLAAMMRFFAPTVTAHRGSLGTELLEFFELDSKASRFAIDIDNLEQYVAMATARLETSWYELAGRYMELKLKYVAA